MTAQGNASLLEPISAERPCGVDLEDSGDLALLEAYQIFGQASLDPPPKDKDKGEAPRRESRKSDRPPNWEELEELTRSCLAKSKDLRVLAHLAACALRTQGLPVFVDILGVALQWLEVHSTDVYPLVDEDAVRRTNALTSFSDRAAMIDGLRRTILFTGRLGRFSLRDLDGMSAPVAADAESRPTDTGIKAAFAEMPIDDLRTLHRRAVEGAAALRAIDEKVPANADVEASAFDAILAQFWVLESALKARLAEHPKAVAGVDEAGATAGAPGDVAVGAVRSRQDAIRALDAVAEFFRRSEPSSPVPLLVDRAKRLVSKNFLEVLADVAPGGLAEAKSASGIRE